MLKEKKAKNNWRKSIISYEKETCKKQCNNKETSTPWKDAYKSCSSKEKAIAKIKRNLPCSPLKRRAVVKKLAWEQIKIKPFDPVKKRSYWSIWTKENMKSVIDFFCSVDVSRQAPGKCDQNKTRWWFKDRKSKSTPGSFCYRGLQYMEVRKCITKNREIYIFKPSTKICVVNISVAGKCMCL